MKGKGIWLVVVSFFLVVGSNTFITDIFAQREMSQEEVEAEDIFSLMKALEVVTPTAKPTPLRLSPGSVSVITAEQIEDFGFESILDMLRLVPGADVVYTMMGRKVGFRSAGDNPFSGEVNFRIDSISYNSADKSGFPQHPGYLSFFPVEMIKQVEVIRGPSSPVWGDYNFWGTVNMVTKDLEGLHFSSQVGENNTEKYTFGFGHNAEEYGFSGIVEYQKTDGPIKLYSHRQIRQTQFYLKGRYKDFSLNFFLTDNRGDPLIVPAFPQFGISELEAAGIRNKVYIGNLTHNMVVSNNLTIKNSIGYHTRRGNNCGACHNPNALGPWSSSGVSPRTGMGEKFVQYSVKTTLDYSPWEDHSISIGGEFIENHDDMFQNTTLYLGDKDTDWTNLSFYLQDEIKWLKNKNLITNIGIRYDWNEFEGGKHISPKVAVVYAPTEQLVLRSSFSKGLRFPNWHDRYLRMPILGLAAPLPFPIPVLEGNEDLKAEEITMGELGAEYYFAKNFSTKVDFFVSEIKNQIELGEEIFDPTPDIFPQELDRMYENNPNKYWISGGEIEFRNSFLNNKLRTILGYAYQQVGGEANGGGKPPVSAPVHKYNFALTYMPLERLKLNLFVSFRDNVFPITQYDSPTMFALGYEHKPRNAYTMVDAKIDWLIPVGDSKLKLSLIGKNLLDDEVQQTFNFFIDTSLVGRLIYFKASMDF